MSDATEIVEELLSHADVETITERNLRSQVAQQLERELTPEEIKSVRAVIESFIQTMDPQIEQKSDRTTAEGSPQGDVGQKRKLAPSEPVSKSKTVKKETAVEKPSAATESDAKKSFTLSELKRVEVRTFKSRVLIDIRECYKDKFSGELKPGKKGLSLQPDQWQKLSDCLPELETAYKAGDTSCVIHLSTNRRATVSKFKGVARVDIREYYQDDGEWKHGQKGVGLGSGEWATLVENKDKISNAVKALGA